MRYSKLGYLGLPVAGVGLFAVGIAALLLVLPAGQSWTKAILLCLVTAAAASLALASYRHADEIILGRQKTSWFWGSLIAPVISLPVVVGYCWNLLPLPIVADPHAAFGIGFAFLLLMQGLVVMALNLIRHLRDRSE
jgi:hypothetical protein